MFGIENDIYYRKCHCHFLLLYVIKKVIISYFVGNEDTVCIQIIFRNHSNYNNFLMIVTKLSFLYIIYTSRTNFLSK